MWDGLYCTWPRGDKVCGNLAFRRVEDRIDCAICEFCFREYVSKVGIETARARCPMIQVKPRARSATISPQRMSWHQKLMRDDD